jgi:hypothetical protein
MSFESLKDKIVKSGTKNQWEEVYAHKKNNLHNEHVFMRYTPYESKTRGTIHRVQINIGDRIASLFNLTKGGRVNVYVDKTNPALFLLKVSDNENGYLLSKTKGASVVMINFVLSYAINIPEYSTQQVFFDVESDNSLLIDLSKKPK